MNRILILSLLVASQLQAEPIVWEQLQKYYDSFVRAFHTHSIVDLTGMTRELDLNFRLEMGGIPTQNTAGNCAKGRDAKVITIDQEIWLKLPEGEREAVVFHELGHCILNRDHDSRQWEGRPISIMFPSTIEEKTYLEHRDQYLEELFLR